MELPDCSTPSLTVNKTVFSTPCLNSSVSNFKYVFHCHFCVSVFFSSLNEVKDSVAFVQCRLIYLSNLVIILIRDSGEVFRPHFASRCPLIKKKNNKPSKQRNPRKLFESSISGWVHVLACSWFIYCVWPGWLLEVWRYSACCRKSAGANVRHSTGLRQMQVQDYRGICALFAWDGAIPAPATGSREAGAASPLSWHMTLWDCALPDLLGAGESLVHFVNINPERADLCTSFLFEAQNPRLSSILLCVFEVTQSLCCHSSINE